MGYAPLHYAAEIKDVTMVKLFINTGALLETRNEVIFCNFKLTQWFASVNINLII